MADATQSALTKTSGYARKHNPFMSFVNIQNNTARCQNIVSAETIFANDAAKGDDAPQYMFYVPNLANDAHDANVTYAQKDLQTTVDIMLNNKDFMKHTLILITFDENDKSLLSQRVRQYDIKSRFLSLDIYSPQFYGTPNDVYTVLLGNDTLKCYSCRDQSYCNHFSQIVTVEQNWNFSTIPNPDRDGAGWDSWMLPFGMLRKTTGRGLALMRLARWERLL